jgi:NADPH:quinone reductase
MRAARATTYGGPEVIEIHEVPTPSPGKGEALIRVEAAGVNFIDVYHRSGLYKTELPVKLGQEGSGTVEAIGEDVNLAVGQRVAWSSIPGSYASHLLAPASKLVNVPDGLDARLAAAAMLQGMTAHYLARSTFVLNEDTTCLIHAAAGGVGLLLCQLAKKAGAHAIGTVSTEEKAKLAREAGARDVILYTQEDFATAVRKIVPRGVDVVYDSVGKTTFDKSLTCLRPRGMMVTFGQSSGAIPPFDVATREEFVQRATEVLELVEDGDLEVKIHAALSLEQAGEAHTMLEGRETTGKLLLLP